MSDAIKIPYVCCGEKSHITQEIAEQHVKTADYWYKKYCDLKDCSNEVIAFHQELLADKKTDNRIIMLLSVVCIIETIFLIGGRFL